MNLSLNNSFLRLSLLFVLFNAGTVLHGQDVRQLARAVDEHYNRLRTLQADFTENYRGVGSDRVESGTLWLKKPRKMRWEYRSPRQKLFVSNGKAVWFYMPGERQAQKTDPRKLDDLRSPLAFLLGKTKLESELQGLSRAIDETPLEPGNTILRGIPRAMANRISEVVLEVNPAHQLVRITLTEIDGATTQFLFRNLRENGEISDSRFEFVPPGGIEIVEGEIGP